MKSLLASVRINGGLDRVDQAVHCLEDEWRKHGDVQLERLWTEQKRVLAVDPEASIVLLTELIRADLRCRYARGQSPTVAGYLERFPTLQGADSRVLSLIYEEFCLAEERGAAVNVDSFCDRYLRWKDSLVSQLQYHRLFSQAVGPRPEPPPFPEPGETFEEFQLVSLLGKGGSARVFLARDLSLGGKQVVLKVSLDRGEEPKAQGMLDHPHIVPVNSVVYGDHQLRGLSMPYRPGQPLDEVIRRVDPASRPRRALALWHALVGSPGPALRTGAWSRSALSLWHTWFDGKKPGSATAVHERPDPTSGVTDGRTDLPRGDGWDGFPVRGTYAEGVAWIIMILARALAYAHSMRTFHRDVKPGNVLLTLQHGPQLLDFNLAASPHSVSRAEAAMHGGTLPYMAPEQLEAFITPELWGKVGAQADIYSLGLVLRELLTGQAPDLPAQTVAPPRALRMLLDRRPMLDVSVRRANPAIPHALEAIVAKCLAVAPEARYEDAKTLAEDLDRFLKRLPLAGTSNPSRSERLGNWWMRERRSLATHAGYLLVIGILAFGVVDRVKGWLKPPVETIPDFLEAVRQIDNGEFYRAIPALRRIANTYPESLLLKLYLCISLDAHRDKRAGASHDIEVPPQDLRNRADRESLADRLLKDVIEAAETPEVRKSLVTWAESHLAFASHLEAAALERFDRTERITRDPEYDQREADWERTGLYHLIRKAVELAAELNPRSMMAPLILAIIEENDKQYWSAYQRLTRLIESATLTDHGEYELYRARMVRARVAKKMASHPQEIPRDTLSRLDFMRQAVEDLEYSEQYVRTHGDSERNLFVLSIKVPAYLTLSEIEAEEGKVRDAQEHLEIYTAALEEVEKLRPKSFKFADLRNLPEYQQRAAELRRKLTGKGDGDTLPSGLDQKSSVAPTAP